MGKKQYVCITNFKDREGHKHVTGALLPADFPGDRIKSLLVDKCVAEVVAPPAAAAGPQCDPGGPAPNVNTTAPDSKGAKGGK